MLSEKSTAITKFDKIGLPNHKCDLCTLVFVLCRSLELVVVSNDQVSQAVQSTKYKVLSTKF